MTPDHPCDDNYRTAGPGEIKCKDCAHVVPQPVCSLRRRCKHYGYSYVVGKHHTCDKAEAAKPEEA